eukprot:TRINITY_DN56061_c0_g1_i1.p1 TRINITY_DN56061_c0_g1~~TRINITY_DN56061_c0_g1_i1.p1  ORF type:complete len:291 (-),score=33.81 TRINITY_DN56061_c0_g1_i1:314-1186(-)
MPKNTTYCKEWASTDEVYPLPTNQFLTSYLAILTLVGLICIIGVTILSPKEIRKHLRSAGVAIHKVAKTASEVERKVFHVCGLLVPLIYQVLLQNGFSKHFCLKILWSITIVGCTCDFMRVRVPWVQRNWPLKGILRGKEETQLCGGTYFALGCTLSIQFFAPAIAMTSIIFLVLGDMAAALIGRSFGQSFCSMKLGTDGKKSAEGSVAMFLVCLTMGCTIFSEVHLREYAVCISALVATLTELYEPFGINDNVSIPILSSLALTFGFARTYSCEPSHNPLLWHIQQGFS